VTPPVPTPSPTATPTPAPPPGTTFVVNSTSDAPDNNFSDGVCDDGTGHCTLRAAIQQANASAGADTIAFNFSALGVQTISPTTPLPNITEAVTIDGYTQPGASANTLAVGDNAIILVELSGANITNQWQNGLSINADGCRVRGLAINRFTGRGIAVSGSNNVVEGNFVGTNPAGNAASRNNEGVALDSGAANLVGGTSPAARNVVSGNNGNGITVNGNNNGSTGNTIAGNYVGTNAAGTAALPQPGWAPGIALYSTSNNTVGGTTAGAGNVVAGNAGAGIFVTNTYPGGTPGSSNNTLQGNFVGTTAGGLTALPNANALTINMGSANNTVGGATAAARNLLNGGVSLSDGATANRFYGNYVGINAAGNPINNQPNTWVPGFNFGGASGNFIGGTNPGEGNVISGNSGPGIWLESSCTECNPPQAFVPSTNNVIRGNIIGLKPDGASAAPNNNGIQIDRGSSNNIIGGDDAADGVVDGAVGARNYISGNNGEAVTITNTAAVGSQASANGNNVLGNYIGVKADGTAAPPNGGNGVGIYGVSNTVVSGNVISGNGQNGVSVQDAKPTQASAPVQADHTTVSGNFIGTNPTGTAAIGNHFAGVTINSSNTTTVSGNVVSGNGGNGVFISSNWNDPDGSTSNVVRANRIGTNAAGTTALPNGSGVGISGGSTANTIGGPAASDRNVISGNNGDGVNLGAFGGAAGGNTIQGNYIGVNAAGTARLANQNSGVGVFGVNNTQILGNVISGNGTGVNLGTGSLSQGSPAFNSTGTVVQGNLVGTNAAGTAAIPNSSSGVNLFGASNSQIGGAGSARNVISGNAGTGLSLGVAGPEPNVLLPNNNVIQNNFVGVDLSGASAIPNLGGGITLGGASNNTVSGNVISGNAGTGLSINYNRFFSGSTITVDRNAANNSVVGNLIGTNALGTAALPNTSGGVSVNGATGNHIGGTSASDRNVISGNTTTDALSLNLSTFQNNTSSGANNNTVQGNYIGTTADGTAALRNNRGVVINGSSNNLIGGTTPSARNVISGNANNGVVININFIPFNSPTTVADATGNLVQGNFIGTNAAGTAGVPNGNNGLAVFGSSNTIGGTDAGAGNTVAFNNNVGIAINCVSPPAGAPSSLARCATNNAVLSNSFFSNGNVGISFGSNAAATPTIANAGQAAPSLNFASVSGSNTSASGVLSSTPSAQFRVEFFANDSCDPSGSGEGQTFIGSAQATTDASGFATFNTSSLNPVAAGKVITATATGPNGTSRFSTCRGLSPATVKISGRATDQSGVAISGVNVSLTGSQSATATTDANGNYAFLGVPSNGTYTVSASLAGTTFYPPSYNFVTLPGDQVVNFTKAVVKYTVTDLGALAPQPSSLGWDVNNTGQVAGWSSTASGTNFHPFFYNGTTLTDIAPLGTGTNSLAIAINDAGRVVGYSETTPGSAFHAAYSDNGGALHDLGTLGGTASQAWGVGRNGVVVGQSQIAGNSETHPFIWKDANNDGIAQASELMDVGKLGTGNFGRLFAINSLGVAVGNSNNTLNGQQQATIWRDDNGNGVSDPGELKLLGALGGTFGNASGINDNGYVVGVAATSLFSSFDGRQLTHAFIWHDDNGNGQSDPGEMKDLGTLGGELSSALRINSKGDVVGNSTTTTVFNASAFLYRNGFMLDLNAAIPQDSGWHITEARGINDNGQIVGYGFLPNAATNHALLLTPKTLTDQTVTFDPVPAKTYGGAPFTVNAAASSGLAVTYSVLSGPATANGNTVTINGAGTVTLRASQAGDSTYAPASADQTFTVAPALLRVIADSKTKVYGAPNPTFTVHYSGFVNGDGPAALGGSLTFNTAAPADPVGTYPITPGGLTSNNYALQFLAATLTVDKASTSASSVNYSLPVPGAVSLTAQVNADAPSTLTVAGGNVTFTIRQGTTTIGSVTSGPVANGQASAGFNAASAGAYTVYASYSGSGNYDGSTGLASLTVGNANPVPAVTGVTPDSIAKKATETGQFTLFIDGGGFMSTQAGSPANSAVDWYDRTTGQHTALAVTSITPAQIQAVVPFDLVRDGKTVEVSVINAGPGGGTSNAQPFFITDTTASVTSADTALADPTTGTASTTSVAPSGAVLSADASSGGSGGGGTLTVAQYSADPIGTNSSPNTSAFSTAEGSGYFDVYVAPGSTFTSLTLQYANTGGTTLYWWDGNTWSLVSNQSYNPATGIITVTVTTTSSPSIAQLTGTVFGAASGPAVGSITVSPSATVALGSGPVTLSASFTDAGGSGPYAAEITWGDGQTTTLGNVTGTSLSAAHTYAAAGAYSVKVKVSRGSAFGSSTFSPLVVFDPAAGFLTGGGWFNSPLGALPTNPAFTGKVTFETSVKYESGANVPTGMTKVGLPGMDFSATKFNWLSVTGTKAQAGGTGTINGAGLYGFVLTGSDGKPDGKGQPDRLRVKIWELASGRVIYDGQAGAPDNAPPVLALGGGNVTIHK
jgi:CSLREA domain-containing protein